MSRFSVMVCLIVSLVTWLLTAFYYREKVELVSSVNSDQQEYFRLTEEQNTRLSDAVTALRQENDGLSSKLHYYESIEDMARAEEALYRTGKDTVLIDLAKEVQNAENNAKKLNESVYRYAQAIENKNFLRHEGVSEKYSAEYLIPSRFCQPEYVFKLEEMFACKTDCKTVVKVKFTEYSYGGKRYIKPNIIELNAQKLKASPFKIEKPGVAA